MVIIFSAVVVWSEIGLFGRVEVSFGVIMLVLV